MSVPEEVTASDAGNNSTGNGTVIDNENKTIHLDSAHGHRPACTVYIHDEKLIALRKLDSITEIEYTKALLGPILMSCECCGKPFTNSAKLTDFLMHLYSKQHSNAAGVSVDANPLVEFAQKACLQEGEDVAMAAEEQATTNVVEEMKKKQKPKKKPPPAEKQATQNDGNQGEEENPYANWKVCHICKVVTSHEAILDTHCKGKKHLNLMKYAAPHELANPFGPYIVDGKPCIDITKDKRKIAPPEKNPEGKKKRWQKWQAKLKEQEERKASGVWKNKGQGAADSGGAIFATGASRATIIGGFKTFVRSSTETNTFTPYNSQPTNNFSDYNSQGGGYYEPEEDMSSSGYGNGQAQAAANWRQNRVGNSMMSTSMNQGSDGAPYGYNTVQDDYSAQGYSNTNNTARNKWSGYQDNSGGSQFGSGGGGGGGNQFNSGGNAFPPSKGMGSNYAHTYFYPSNS